MGAQGWMYFVLVVLFMLLNGKSTSKAKIIPNPQGKTLIGNGNNNAVRNKGIETSLTQIKRKLESLDQKITSLVSPSCCCCYTCKFDFEAGINGWEKTGTAFNNQPTYGDNPTARNRGEPANQQGDWWIGGAEDRPFKSVIAGQLQGDTPQGTLTSPYFKINGAQISFLIGGGCDMGTVRAELIVDNRVVRRTTGECNESMKRKAWNVHGYVGQRARVTLVDFSSGGWGHINFDDLKGNISCS